MNKDTDSRYEQQNLLESQVDESLSLQYSEDPTVFSFKGLSLTLNQLKYFTFVFLGIASLWPWNCLLSVSTYYVVKFGGGVISHYFISTMMTVSTLGSLIFNSYLSSRQIAADYSGRIKVGAVINFSIFFILAIMELINHGEHGTVYFAVLMLLVFGSAVGTCFQQNGCMALVNVIGPRYAQGVMVGQAIAGVLPSISLILTILLSYGGQSNDAHAGSIVLYFFTTSLTISASGLLWVYTSTIDGKQFEVEDVPSIEPTDYVPFWTLLGKLFYIVGSIVLVFVVTLPFAPFTSNISSNNNWGELTSDSIFIPFIYFIWNFGDLLGRISCGYEAFLISSDRILFIYAILRFIHIPLYFLCNIHEGKDALIPSDTFYILIQFLFGFTNGHCLSLAFMNVGNYVDLKEREAAGGFTTVFLSLGLVFGSVFSYLFSTLVAS